MKSSCMNKSWLLLGLFLLMNHAFAQSSMGMLNSKAPLTNSSGGRIIGYLPGWKTPPPPDDLAKAGYTHIVIAFGVFSTTTPGQVVSAFDTVTAAYIKSLQNRGIKVLLSIGGASTGIDNTTVNFHQVLSEAPNAGAFSSTLVDSLEGFITQYGFDGIAL